MSERETLYCTFRTADRLFGVRVLDVREVTTESRFTKIPHAPDEVLGLANIRGHIFLALNLATLLGIRDHSPPADSQFVIFKPAVGPAFGIVVDQVGDIVSVSGKQTEVLSPDDHGVPDFSDRSVFVSSVCKLDQQLLIILDPYRFLPCVENSITTILNTGPD